FSSLKIKSFKIDSKFKILNSKLSIIVPSLCLLFVVGLVYFFAFAEPADQLPQNQTFLNLAHQDINASTTAPTTYTSTNAQTTQADFEASGAGGFGYSATTTPDSVVGNDDLGVFRSAPFDLGAKTKLSNSRFDESNKTNIHILELLALKLLLSKFIQRAFSFRKFFVFVFGHRNQLTIGNFQLILSEPC
ncbi:MAG: hypothetical protein ABII99_01875, partial [Patescibacteria group bacterium]